MTFFILTFGCKVNQCESEDIYLAMKNSGFEGCNDYETADIVILNSCAVTAESVRKMRQAIHKVKKINRDSVVAVTGCVAQTEPENVKKIEGVDIVVGNTVKSDIPRIIENHLSTSNGAVNVSPIFKISGFQNSGVNHAPHRSRAFLKIEDGCNRFCSYCIIPYARGQVRSKSIEDIRFDVESLAKNGYKEIVLVGINLSSYGVDIGKNLADAVETVCAVDGVERVRLSSLEPDLMTDEILKRLATQPKLCRQFHLALQSGSDSILKKMRRKYTAEEYLCTVNKIRSMFPCATFTTDLIVGFPSEAEEDFNKSLELIDKVGFLKVHVFPYSVRSGTAAEKFDDQISRAVKAERVRAVIAKSSENCQKVLASFIGKTCEVLYETVDDDGFYEGYTKEYIPVKTRSIKDLRGEILPTKMGEINNDYILCDYI